MATKDKSKEQTEPKEPKEQKEQEQKKDPAKEDFKVRHLTEKETEDLVSDTSVPEGYTNVAVITAEEEPPVEEIPAKTPEPVKTEEKKTPEPAPKEEKKDFFERLELEIVKPEGKENLTEFSPREKAYFYQMRRDRKARQKAEEERDQARFRAMKLEKEKKPDAQAESDPMSVLAGKDDEDLITVQDVKKILAGKKPEEKQPEPDKKSEVQDLQLRYLRMCEKEARAAHKDFDAVMELADELVSNNSEILGAISDRTNSGENPAEVMYELIKSHKDFETLYPAAELRSKAKSQPAKESQPSGATSSVPAPTPEEKAKEDKAKQAEKALEENSNRTKTTAHVSSREGKPAEELTLEEIGKMADFEFSKLPRAVRDRYLRMYGA